MRMSQPADRRSDERELGEAFSPEYLAMLVICGGTVRDSDWDVLPKSLVARRPGHPEELVGETHDAEGEASRR